MTVKPARLTLEAWRGAPMRQAFKILASGLDVAAAGWVLQLLVWDADGAPTTPLITLDEVAPGTTTGVQLDASGNLVGDWYVTAAALDALPEGARPESRQPVRFRVGFKVTPSAGEAAYYGLGDLLLYPKWGENSVTAQNSATGSQLTLDVTAQTIVYDLGGGQYVTAIAAYTATATAAAAAAAASAAAAGTAAGTAAADAAAAVSASLIADVAADRELAETAADTATTKAGEASDEADAAAASAAQAALVNFTAVSANAAAVPPVRYLCDSSGGPFTITLPAAPTLGAHVQVKDAVGGFTTNPVTIARNGQTIAGLAADLTLDVAWTDLLFVFTGSTWIF